MVADPPEIGVAQKLERKAHSLDHEMQPVREGEERPGKACTLAERDDAGDESRGRARCAAGHSCDFENLTALDRPIGQSTQDPLDWRIEIAFRKKAVGRESQTGGAKHLVTLVNQRYDA